MLPDIIIALIIQPDIIITQIILPSKIIALIILSVDLSGDTIWIILGILVIITLSSVLTLPFNRNRRQGHLAMLMHGLLLLATAVLGSAVLGSGKHRKHAFSIYFNPLMTTPFWNENQTNAFKPYFFNENA